MDMLFVFIKLGGILYALYKLVLRQISQSQSTSICGRQIESLENKE